MPQHDDEPEDVTADANERMDAAGSADAGDRTDTGNGRGTADETGTADGTNAADGGGTGGTAERAESAGSGESTDVTSPTEVIEPADEAMSTSATETAAVPAESIDSVLGTSVASGYGFTDTTRGPADPSGSYGPTPPTARSSSEVPYGAFSGATYSGTASWGAAVSVRPRVRAGAIVWGVLVMAFAAAVIVVSASPDARYAFDAWQASLTPVAWAVIGVVALGVAVLLIAGTSAIRGAQRRVQARDRG